jgi:hypothetical protein
MNNLKVPMTRRYPHLKSKQKIRDAKIAKQIITAWDVEEDSDKVLQIFLNKKHKLSDYRYWEVLRSVWIVAGSLKNLDIFRLLFNSKRKYIHYFSTPEEIERLENLDDQVKVYRVCNNEIDDGISWTLSMDYALWYKEKYNKKIILHRLIDKSDIFALIERNREEEIIIF